MIMFRSKTDIYEWFQQIQGWNRMDFLCNLIHLCNPFELRFIGSCIEDLAQMDYNTLRDQEIKANGIENLEQFINKCPPVDEFRSHLLVCLALLQSSNYKVAAKLADVLNEKLDGLNLEHLMEAGLDAEVEQWMLMLTLAAYHPAFSFEKKLKFKEQLSNYGRMNTKERKTFPQQTWCRRNHRCSQSSHVTEECENAEWSTEMTADPVPFQSYSIYPEHGYGYTDYNPAQYQGNPIHRNIQEGYARLQPRLPTFPTALAPMGSRDASPHGVNCPQGVTSQSYNMNSVRHGRTNRLNSAHQTLPITAENFHSIAPNPSSTVDCVSLRKNAPIPSTVSLTQTFSNALSASSSVSTTTVFMKTTSHTTHSGAEHLSWGSGYMPLNTRSRQFKPNSDQNSFRTRHDTQFQRSKNRNRSQSGDTNSGKKPWKETRENSQNSGRMLHQLRICTSAPVLATPKSEQTKTSSDVKKENHNEIAQNLRNKVSSPCLTTMKLRPVNVSVSVIPKNKRESSKGGTRFTLKADWNDGTTSECARSVEEMAKFYKQVTGKSGLETINIDSLAKQNNQILERREKLEGILSEVVASTVNDSNRDRFRTFFNRGVSDTPASSLPKKRKFRTGSKLRANLDGGSSSSSNSSPPLLTNNSKSILISPPNSRPESSISPLSNKESTSSSSVLSSPTSGTNATQISSRRSEVPQSDNDTTNDPYLKLYYWLKEKNLAKLYTHLTSFQYDEFFKLQPSDIDKLGSLSSEQKLILKRELTKMKDQTRSDQSSVPVEGEDETLGIDMGMLSLSPSLVTDENKTKDIKTILEDVARTVSEDEKSGSYHSAPVEMPDTDDIQAIASNSCFSFEFDSSSATVDSSSRSRRNNQKCNDDTDTDIMGQEDGPGIDSIEYFRPSNKRLCDPQRAWSQGDIRPPGYPFSNVSPRYLQRSAPPMAPLTYFTRPIPNDMTGNPMLTRHYFSSQSGMPFRPPLRPNATVTMVHHPAISQPLTVTVPSPISQKQPRYPHVPSTGQHGVVYPLANPYCMDHSITPSTVDILPSGTHVVYDVMPSEVQNSTSANLELSGRISPEFSDLDSSSFKTKDISLAQSRSDTVKCPAHTNYMYNPAQRFQYNLGPQPWTVPHTSLASSCSDPTSFMPKMHRDFGDHSLLVTCSSVTANGYSEMTNSYSMPSTSHNSAMPHSRHHSGDAMRKTNSPSCFNCGRKGHEASSCIDPNPVEVLGKDFHLKMSQPSQGR